MNILEPLLIALLCGLLVAGCAAYAYFSGKARTDEAEERHQKEEIEK